MQINLDDGPAVYRIRSYENKALQINQTLYTQSLTLCGQKVWTETYLSPQSSIEEAECFLKLLAFTPQIVLFGTGEQHEFLAPKLQKFFHQQAIGVESMNTASATRTYNVLIAEGRVVVASLKI